MLVAFLAEHEDVLRADLQRVYGIDLDHAIAGAHSSLHIAALVANLPQDALIHRKYDPDAAWTLTDVLLAAILNTFKGFVWGMSDKRKRGPAPALVGPSYMSERNKVMLPARTMSIDELLNELEKPRSNNG